MPHVTVSGGGSRPQPLPVEQRIVALAIAIELEIDAYRRWRIAFHEHRRHNTADSGRAHDDALRVWQESITVRDNKET